jgi:copper homeostasis protein
MLEVCVDSVQAAIIAEQAGADRIELCSVLDVGGVTPTAPLIAAVRRSIRVPLIVLNRARAGNFIFDQHDRDVMTKEARQAIELGADGVAVGGLVESRDLDLQLLESLVQQLSTCQLVMHRAFDQTRDPFSAMEQLIQLGFTRILTGGGCEKAIDGKEQLAALTQRAQGRIEILPAGGIGPSNAREILMTTAGTQLHGSFRTEHRVNDGVRLPDEDAIRKTKAIMESLR